MSSWPDPELPFTAMMRSDFFTVVVGEAALFQVRIKPGCTSTIIASLSVGRSTSPSGSSSDFRRAMRNTSGRSKVRLTAVDRVISSAMNSVLLPGCPSMKSSRCLGFTANFLLVSFHSFTSPSEMDFTRHTCSSELSRTKPTRVSREQLRCTSKSCASSTSVGADPADRSDRCERRADPRAETSSATHSEPSSTTPLWQQLPMATVAFS
mmetsp:Transcript_22077/g.51844  ORF Transcript_22077/g.51844 Transcript_22077/m.51844 type:complete len:209 (+) Transcript_22077:296-922(+)